MNTDERLTALIEALWDYHRPDASLHCYDELVDRLAALRAPGVGADDRCRRATQRLVEIAGVDGPMSLEDAIEWAGGKVEALESALATARRERDEAVGVVSAWLDYRDRKGIADNARDPGLAAAIRRARALVAGQGAPGPRDAEIAGWRESAKALTGEIATLRAYLAEAQGEVTNERAKRIAAEHATGDTEEALLRVERDRDALRARIAELEARDREARGLLKPGPVNVAEWGPRRDAYLSSAPIPDPARGLIERAVGWIHTRFHETGVSEPASRLLQDLRAYLGGG